MHAFFWKHFPIFYILPFLLATVQMSQIAALGEALRWVILLIGCGMAVQNGFKRAGLKRKCFTWADRAIIVFLTLFLVSEIWTIQPWITSQRAISMVLLYGCSFWTLWEYADRFSEQLLIQRLLQTLCIILTVNLLSAFVLPSAWLAGRFRGVFINPNNIGLMLCVVMPLAISQCLYARQRLSLATTVVFFLSLIACGSRSTMLGTAVATVMILISLFVKRSVQVIIVSILALVGLAFFIQTDFFTTNILRESSLTTASNRTFFWNLGKTYISYRPDFGHGFGTDTIIHDYYGIVLRDLSLRGAGVMSSYYGLAVQIGWPLTYGFFSLLWGFILYCFSKYWQDYRLVSLLSALTSGLIVCIFEPAITSAGNVFSLFFWTALMLAIRRRYYKKVGLTASI